MNIKIKNNREGLTDMTLTDRTTKSYKNHNGPKYKRHTTIKKHFETDDQIRNKSQYLFNSGKFTYNIYSDIDPAYKRNLTSHVYFYKCLPAIIISVFAAFAGIKYDTGMIYILGFYALGIISARKLLKQYRVHIRVATMEDKGQLNRIALHAHKHNNVSNTELNLLNICQEKANEYCLFPSKYEMIALYQNQINSYRHVDMADMFSVDERRKEHLAAKELADLKQQKRGGRNKYDLMVKKYLSRTTPEMKTMINGIR